MKKLLLLSVALTLSLSAYSQRLTLYAESMRYADQTVDWTPEEASDIVFTIDGVKRSIVMSDRNAKSTVAILRSEDYPDGSTHVYRYHCSDLNGNKFEIRVVNYPRLKRFQVYTIFDDFIQLYYIYKAR